MPRKLNTKTKEDPSAKTRTLRYTTMLFCVLVTALYAFFYNSKSQTTNSATASKSQSPELARVLQENPNSLSDDEYIAAALAWEKERKELQEERDDLRREIGIRKNPHYIYADVVNQLHDNIEAIGDSQPMLQQPFRKNLEALEADRPGARPNRSPF